MVSVRIMLSSWEPPIVSAYRQRADYPAASESVFQLLVVGDGTWELQHADVPLVTVQFAAPRLPEQPLQRQRLDDIAGRVFGDCIGPH
jgi:hypothetical protein